eukprot:TRINITY_DN2392_c0_g2_i1.p1 TRINITY_DN2392_c0_g2~~TRINITY_DN2392_c0_g2_i1.p1  ORF type:complete len:475 (+),score=101.78 TRINITY_DN2392_c0_g2_i1:270-1694(+)
MYATRQATAGIVDENKKGDGGGKAPAGKGAAAGRVATSHSNRRALGDIGNLVAMTTRCQVKGEAESKEDLPTKQTGASDHTAPSAARKFGTQVNGAARGPTSSFRRSVAGKQVLTKGESSVKGNNSSSEVGSNAMPSGRRTTTRATRVPKERAAKGMTATLMDTSRQAVSRQKVEEHFDEMVDDALPDVDSEDKNDPQCVSEYLEDILAFYKKTEIKSVVSPDYMVHQADINEKMRAILIDWLIEVHLKFKLMPETLFLTINLLDRFLACHQVSRKNLQLVGVTAMLLASKYEEIWAPEVKDFVYISDSAYNKDEILSTEKVMLNTLQFDLTVPTPYVFVTRFLKVANGKDDVVLTNMTYFFVELSLPEYLMVRYSPSHLAAAALYAAKRTICQEPNWDKALERHSGYTEVQLRGCCTMMLHYHRKSTEMYQNKKGLTAVHKKYGSAKFHEVAKYKPAEALPVDDCTSTSSPGS